MKGWDMISDIKSKINESGNVSKVAAALKIDRKTVRKYRDMPMEEIAEKHQNCRSRTRPVDDYKEFIDDQADHAGIEIAKRGRADGEADERRRHQDLQVRFVPTSPVDPCAVHVHDA